MIQIQYADGLLHSLIPPPPAKSAALSSSLPSMGLQIGLWLNGTFGCDQIIQGQMETQIEQLAHYIYTSVASKIFLRIGYEFDNPYFGYSLQPQTFILAYQHVVRGILTHLAQFNTKQHTHNNNTVHGMNKVQFVWHSWAAPTSILENQDHVLLSSDQDFQLFYPGDEYVDWIGVSIFQQVYSWLNPVNEDGIIDTESTDTNHYSYAGSLQNVENVLKFAQVHKKPTMIAESTPFGGIQLQKSSTKNIPSSNLFIEDPWDRWYRPVLSLIEQYDIGMWSYIDCDWNSLPMWKDVGFGDSRIASDPLIMKHWQDVIFQEGSMGRQFMQMNTMDLCIHDHEETEEDEKDIIHGGEVIPLNNNQDGYQTDSKISMKPVNSIQDSYALDSILMIIITTLLVFLFWFRCRRLLEIEKGNRDETIPIIPHERK